MARCYSHAEVHRKQSEGDEAANYEQLSNRALGSRAFENKGWFSSEGLALSPCPHLATESLAAGVSAWP